MTTLDQISVWALAIALLASNLFSNRMIAEAVKRRRAMNVLGFVLIAFFVTRIVLSFSS